MVLTYNIDYLVHQFKIFLKQFLQSDDAVKLLFAFSKDSNTALRIILIKYLKYLFLD